MPDWVVTAGTNGGLGCGIAQGRLRACDSVSAIAPAGRLRYPDSLQDCPPAGRPHRDARDRAYAGLRQHDDALGQLQSNGSSQPRIAPSEASAISNAIPI